MTRNPPLNPSAGAQGIFGSMVLETGDLELIICSYIEKVIKKERECYKINNQRGKIFLDFPDK